jgi:hypothetical protein
VADEDFFGRGRYLAEVSRIDKELGAVIVSFSAHQRVDDERFHSFNARIERLEAVGSSQQRDALSAAQSEIVLREQQLDAARREIAAVKDTQSQVKDARSHEWVKGLVLLLVTTVVTAIITMIISRLLGA